MLIDSAVSPTPYINAPAAVHTRFPMACCGGQGPKWEMGVHLFSLAVPWLWDIGLAMEAGMLAELWYKYSVSGSREGSC